MTQLCKSDETTDSLDPFCSDDNCPYCRSVLDIRLAKKGISILHGAEGLTIELTVVRHFHPSKCACIRNRFRTA